MPPRQPFPVRGGMPRQIPKFGPNQMGPMMNPTRMGGMGIGNRGLSRSPMSMNAARGMGGATKARGGGLLAKLLGKGQSGGAQAGMQMLGNAGRSAAPSAGGGLLKSLTDPTAITGFLNNTQRVLNTAQQIGPMVQQYGPIIKNLPAMWKLYRGLNSASTEDSTDTTGSTESNVASNTTEETSEGLKTNTRKRKPTISNSNLIEIEEEEEPVITKGKSVPKIYV